MDFKNIKEIIIPQGTVIKITNANNIILWNASKLPSEYREVEWIKAAKDVGAYIDLGFTFDTKATIYLTQYIHNIATTVYPFGAAENSGTRRCLLSCPYSGGASFYGANSSGFIQASCKILTDDTNGALNRFEMHIEPSNLQITNLTSNTSNGVLKTQISYVMSNKLYLFAQNYNGSPRFGGIRQISEFKYYDKNDNLICDLVPCYRRADGVIGMYDVVRKIFLTNVGSGSFIKGAPIQEEATIFKNWVPYSINADGTIYNDGLGYKNDYRVRSGGEEAYSAGTIITGFIPFKKNDTLRIYPAFTEGNTWNTINFYDANFNNLGQKTDSGSEYGICEGKGTIYKATVTDEVSILTYTDNFDTSIAYVRVGNQLNGDVMSNDPRNFIITINEEI